MSPPPTVFCQREPDPFITQSICTQHTFVLLWLQRSVIVVFVVSQLGTPWAEDRRQRCQTIHYNNTYSTYSRLTDSGSLWGVRAWISCAGRVWENERAQSADSRNVSLLKYALHTFSLIPCFSSKHSSRIIAIIPHKCAMCGCAIPFAPWHFGGRLNAGLRTFGLRKKWAVSVSMYVLEMSVEIRKWQMNNNQNYVGEDNIMTYYFNSEYKLPWTFKATTLCYCLKLDK